LDDSRTYIAKYREKRVNFPDLFPVSWELGPKSGENQFDATCNTAIFFSSSKLRQQYSHNPPFCPLEGNKHSFHLYLVLIDPDIFGINKIVFVHTMLYVKEIKVRTHYNPLHWSTAFQRRGFTRNQFPNVNKVGECLFTLPVNSLQTPEAHDYLIHSIHELANG